MQTDWSRDSSIWAQFKSYLWRIGPLCMLDRKWRQSRDRKRPCPEVCSAHAQPFSPEVTKSRDRKRPCPALPFSRIFPRTIFPYIFFSRTPPPYFFSYFFLYFFPPYYFPVLFLKCWNLYHLDFFNHVLLGTKTSNFKKKVFDGPCTAQKNQKMHIWNYMHKRMEILHIN